MVMSSRSALLLSRRWLSKSVPASVVTSIRNGFSLPFCPLAISRKIHVSSRTKVTTSLHTYIRLHTCPRYLYFLLLTTQMNPAAFEHWESRALPLVETDEMCSPSAASINPSKMDAASPSAASPPGKLRGSDCSGTTGTPDCMIFTSPARILREIISPRIKDCRGLLGTPPFKIV